MRKARSHELPLEMVISSAGPAGDAVQPLPTLEELLNTERPEEGEPWTDNETFIPVHGFVGLSDAEMRVVNHPAFQRLGNIYQLGQTHLVYRGATHKRFEHVIGTVHVAQQIADAIAANHHRLGRRRATAMSSRTPLCDSLTPTEVVFVRLAALVHDIGHLPEGHTLEDELGFLDKHDKVGRLNRVLDRTDWPGGDNPPLRSVIDVAYSPYIRGSRAISPAELAVQLVAKDAPEHLNDAAESIVRVGVCRDIVGNTICADLLDYLHRDWYHIGKPRYYDQRLFQYMEIRKDHEGRPCLVISLGARPKIRTDAITAILGLLESRYELAESVLFHRTKCSAAAMLERALYELEDAVSETEREHWKASLEKALLDHSDDTVADLLLGHAQSHKANSALLPLNALRQRRLYKAVSTITLDQLVHEEEGWLTRLYTKTPVAARARNEALRGLERDFKLPAGSLAIYCPDKGMNAKIAKVKIHVNGEIAAFQDFEQSNRNLLSGGHLVAQIDRFHKLWRIHVVIDENSWTRMSEDLRQCLRDAVDVCILGRLRPGQTIETAVRMIAAVMAVTSDSPYHGQTLRPIEVGARGGDAIIGYPSGAPAIELFFGEKL